LRHGEEDWGSQFSNPLCPCPGLAVGYAVYLPAGFPFFVLKKAFVDFPAWLMAPSEAVEGTVSAAAGRAPANRPPFEGRRSAA
ncbi:MAG: hypothetical protein ACREI7_08440, partial [Myxococcota bacterium]